MRFFPTSALLKTEPPTQVNKSRLFLIWLGFFPPRKWVFIYSHQRAIGAFQQRWWQDIKQIVCNEVIIKHNPVVSHTDLSLWQKTTNTHTPFSGYILTRNTSSHTPLWSAPPRFSLHHHKRWRMYCLFLSRPSWVCVRSLDRLELKVWSLDCGNKKLT